MEFFETLYARHSHRGGFAPEPVPREDLRKIVEAGMAAPSGCNGQTTRFVVVDDPDLLVGLRTFHGMRAVKEAPAMIVCLVDREAKPVYEGMAFQVEDCAAAVENMLLAITALGYASVWIDGALRVDGRARALAELLRIPEDREIRVILPVGKAREESPRREKMSFEERAGFNALPEGA